MTVEQFDPKQKLEQPEGINLTPEALKQLVDSIAKRGKGLGMRISITTEGCSGYMYQIDYVDEPNDDDYVFPVTSGLSVYVDPKSLTLIDGTTVDFVKEGLKSQFVFDNPRATGGCGCGESFQI